MNYILYIILGLAAGVLSGMFGIGGGVILIPGLVFLAGLTQHQAQGTTLAAMIPPIGLLAAIQYYGAGNVNVWIALMICIGFFLGGFLGANIAHSVADSVLKKLFGVFLLFVSASMIFGK